MADIVTENAIKRIKIGDTIYNLRDDSAITNDDLDGLVTGGFTEDDRANLDSLVAGRAALVNIIESVKVNGVALTPNASKAVEIEVPFTPGSGANSAKQGTSTQASGANSVAVGTRSAATGPNAFAGGDSTSARGEDSFAFGKNVSTNNTGEAAFGCYNRSLSGHTVFSVGIGDDQDRRNAIEVRKDGTVYIPGLSGFATPDQVSESINDALSGAQDKLEALQIIFEKLQDDTEAGSAIMKAIALKEDKANKATTITSGDNLHYPTVGAVHTFVNSFFDLTTDQLNSMFDEIFV